MGFRVGNDNNDDDENNEDSNDNQDNDDNKDYDDGVVLMSCNQDHSPLI